jgi:hypothetical protein
MLNVKAIITDLIARGGTDTLAERDAIDDSNRRHLEAYAAEARQHWQEAPDCSIGKLCCDGSVMGTIMAGVEVDGRYPTHLLATAINMLHELRAECDRTAAENVALSAEVADMEAQRDEALHRLGEWEAAADTLGPIGDVQ